MAARTDRGQGIPFTDAERQARHFEETGEWLDELPVRGTGLSNPDLSSLSDSWSWLKANWKWVVGIGGGAGLLYWLSKKI